MQNATQEKHEYESSVEKIFALPLPSQERDHIEQKRKEQNQCGDLTPENEAEYRRDSYENTESSDALPLFFRCCWEWSCS